MLFAIHRRMDPVIDTTEIAKEIAARVREELDYGSRGQARRALSAMLAGSPIRVPARVAGAVDRRLLTLDWLEGASLLAHKDEPLDQRNRLGAPCSRPGGCRSAATG